LSDETAQGEELVYGTGGGRELKADLFRPTGEDAGPFPAVVYVHGGGWRQGDRKHFARQAAHMAEHGFLGLCIEYRLSDEATYPAALQDVNCAVRFVRAAADWLNADPDHVGIAGGSAGGHLAAMVAVTGGTSRWEGTGGHGDCSSEVQAYVGFNPAVDLRSRSELEAVVKFLGGTPEEVGEDLYEEASPICHVDSDTPPSLLLHGTEDGTVPYEQSVRFCEAVREAGGHAELFTAEGASHAFFNGPPWFEPTLKSMREFFTRWLAEA
jgi:acetyl esterase/lipase